MLLTLVALVACSAAVFAEVAPNPEGLQVDVDVAPSVLNIQSKGEVVRVHTDIDFLLVDASNVCLNGVLIYRWTTDDRGDLVAKFWMDEVKDLPLVLDAHNTLLLTVKTRSQHPLWEAQDTLLVSKGAQSRLLAHMPCAGNDPGSGHSHKTGMAAASFPTQAHARQGPARACPRSPGRRNRPA